MSIGFCTPIPNLMTFSKSLLITQCSRQTYQRNRPLCTQRNTNIADTNDAFSRYIGHPVRRRFYSRSECPVTTRNGVPQRARQLLYQRLQKSYLVTRSRYTPKRHNTTSKPRLKHHTHNLQSTCSRQTLPIPLKYSWSDETSKIEKSRQILRDHLCDERSSTNETPEMIGNITHIGNYHRLKTVRFFYRHIYN